MHHAKLESSYLIDFDHNKAIVRRGNDLVGDLLAVQHHGIKRSRAHRDSDAFFLGSFAGNIEDFLISFSVVVERKVLQRKTCALPFAREAGRDGNTIFERIDSDSEQTLDHHTEISARNVGKVHITKVTRTTVRLNVRCHTGVLARKIAIRDTVKNFLSRFLQTKLKVHQRQVRVFRREKSAVGILLRKPVRRVAKSAAADRFHTLDMVFGKLQHTICLEVIDHIRVDRMIDAGKLDRGVKQTISDRVKAFCKDAVVRHPKLFEHRLFDLLCACFQSRSVATDLLCDLREHVVGTVVHCRRLITARAVVVMTVGDPRVQLILIQSVAVGIKGSLFPIEHHTELVKILLGNFEIARPFDIIHHHIKGAFLHIVCAVSRRQILTEVGRQAADGIVLVVDSSAELVKAFGNGGIVIPYTLVLDVSAADESQVFVHRFLDAVSPTERGGRVPISPTQERCVVGERTVVEGILVPRSVKRDDGRYDRKIDRILRRFHVDARNFLVDLLLDVGNGIFHRKPLVKRFLVRVIEGNDISVKHLPRLNGCRDLDDLIVLVFRRTAEKCTRIGFGHRLCRAETEVGIKARGNSHRIAVGMGHAGAVFAELDSISFGVLHRENSSRLALILKAAERIGQTAKACGKEYSLIGRDSVMNQITVVGKKRIGFHIDVNVGKPSRHLRELVFHPAVFELGKHVLRIVEPT